MRRDQVVPGILLILAASCARSTPASDEALRVDMVLGGPQADALYAQVDVLADELTVDCMKAQGFDWVAPARPVSDERTDTEEDQTDYGVVDSLELAASDPAPVPVGFDEAEGTAAGLSEAGSTAYDVALFGSGDVDGCAGLSYEAAREQLGVEDLLAELSGVGEQYQAWATSAEAQLLWEQWRSCMADSGFDVANQEDVFLEIERLWLAGTDNGSAARVFEREIFTADQACIAAFEERSAEVITELVEAVPSHQ